MIYVLLVDGFEEIEAIEPIDILRRGGAEVKTVGVYGMEVTGSHGIKIAADIAIDGVDADDMELLMLPGGPGHSLIEESEKAEKLILSASEKNCWLAAICASPSILGKMGLLRGKTATCFPGYEKFLEGADVTANKVERDGKIITAKGAGAASEFGFAILEALKGKETADKIKDGMQY
jgi:4-methyl-5(b-hydroxyethyl)-thiazole monophosphate biosynthesis